MKIPRSKLLGIFVGEEIYCTGRVHTPIRKSAYNIFSGGNFSGASNGGTLLNLSSEATDPQVREAIEKNIKKYGGDGVIDVRIKYGSNPIQWFLTAITAGTWMPGTVTVTGTVVKAVY
jgi:hypothetical protein